MKKVIEKFENFIDKYGKYIEAVTMTLYPSSVQRNYNIKK